MSETELVSFRALQLANEHRNAYGLRYNDYHRYRNHCGNKTHRLRSTLKMTHGKGRDFKKLPPIMLESIKPGHLQLLLFESERAWAYSQELYTSSLQHANKESTAKLRHSATVQRFSAESMVEVTAYTLILSGRFLRFRDEYEDSLDQLCVAREILDCLAECAESSKDQALATLFYDEISPEIRYCAHQLGHANAYDVGRIVSEVSPKRRTTLVENYEQLIHRLKKGGQGDDKVKGRSRLQELMWEGQAVPVRNPELVDILLDVQKAETQLKTSDGTSKLETGIITSREKGRKRQHKSRKGVAAFDAILAALSDAEEATRKLVDSQRTTSGSVKSGTGTRDIHFLHAYIVYQLLSRRVERDLTLISALITSSRGQRKQLEGANEKCSECTERTDARVNPALVKLLDAVLQSLTHMRSLSIVDENPSLANAVETRLEFTKSRRQYAQALSLLQRASVYIKETLTLLSDDTINAAQPLFYYISSDIVSELGRSLQADETRLKRDWFSFNGGSAKAEKDISKKPLFFDIALNYVQLDMDILQERAGIKTSTVTPKEPLETRAVPATKAMEDIDRASTPEPSVPRGGGLSTLLGGWWGRK
ncbi:hypothetical protein EW145_g174 [Phellinidium pouzarii]|uniref:Signal recognition particle subunit SRP68 n=1 Tax=Phellinidium pouzarii TaxID=167371 RepID=A0A4S4LJZ3_9AGAM|nr:hypothetical protein EW145_g174 [Phellinidium pouzarii]